MKKIIILLLILAVAAFIGMPYFTGKIAQSETEKLVKQLNQNSQSYGSNEILKYERGYKSTQSSFKYTPPNSDTEVVYSCDGSHGITSYSYKCKIDSFADYESFVEQHLNGKDPISLTGNVSAFGAISQQINLDAIKNVEIEGNKINFDGGLLNVETNKELSEFVINGDLGASDFVFDDVSLKMDSVKVDGEGEIADDGIYFGDISYSTSGFMMNGEKTVQAKKFDLSLEVADKGKNVAFSYNINAQDAVISDVPAIDKATIKFLGKGFNRESVVQLNDLARQISEQSSAPTPQQQALLIPAVEGLMKKGLNLTLDVDVKFDKDEMNSLVDVKLIDDATFTDFSAVMFNPESLLDKLSIESKAFFPDTVLALDPSFAAVVENSPLSKRENNGFKADLILKKDNLKLNGESITFQELMNSVL